MSDVRWDFRVKVSHEGHKINVPMSDLSDQEAQELQGRIMRALEAQDAHLRNTAASDADVWALHDAMQRFAVELIPQLIEQVRAERTTQTPATTGEVSGL